MRCILFLVVLTFGASVWSEPIGCSAFFKTKKKSSSATDSRGPSKDLLTLKAFTYEHIKRLDKSYREKLPQRAYDGGEYVGEGYWYQWKNNERVGTLPQQGWKLHISARTNNAERVMEVLLPELRHKKIDHKVVKDLKHYHYFLVEIFESTQAGKFITVYPKNTAETKAFSEFISETLQTAGFMRENFFPISGEREVGIGVYSRYGRIVSGDLKNPNGHKIPDSSDHLLKPDGSLDVDLPGRYKPDWVKDIFNESIF